MAIIVVNEIPKANRPQKTEPFDYRGKTRTDLEYAWNEHISKFEFVGYKSNASAMQYAKSEAFKLFEERCYRDVKNSVEETLKEELKKKLGSAVKYIRVDYRRSAEPAIRIVGVTVSGVKRLFGEINWDYIEHLHENLLDTYRKKCSDKKFIADCRERLAREKARERMLHER